LKPIAAVNMGVGPRIMLASGNWFDFLDVRGSTFTINDIAHGLSHICRYSGQCFRFYSVAEHSLYVCGVADSHKLEALMHDAAEAFLGDITRPLKQLLPQYKSIERDVELAIFERFNLDHSALAELKAADLSVLAAEQLQLMPPGTNYWAKETGVAVADIKIAGYTPPEAKSRFLAKYHELQSQKTTSAAR
jgi:uncharacterized protein